MKALFQGILIGLLLQFYGIVLASPQSQQEQIHFGLYVQGDDVNYWGDKIDIVTNRENFKDGVNCPRARFMVDGRKQDWAYQFSYDAAEVLIRDAFLSYEEFKSFHIRVGQYKTPYSFWFKTSHSLLEFLEIGLPTTAFEPGFRGGLQVEFFPDPVTFSMGLITPDVTNTIMRHHLKGHTPLAANARLTFAPIHTEDHTLHFAMAGIFQDTDSLARFRFRSFPEVQNAHNHFLVDTGFIPRCKNYIGEEIEMAIILKSCCFVAEYYSTAVNKNPSDDTFEGLLLTFDYFLTGENYIYSYREGTISSISKIKHSYGAWQLAGRYSRVDLMGDRVPGGREHNASLALNWLVSDNLKLAINYIAATANPSDNGLNRYMNIIALRCQISARS